MTALIELYANNAYSTLANSILSTDTTINVTSGSSFPNPSVGTQFFRLTITSHTTPNSIVEIVYVTARSGGALTVIRGQEGTTAQAWSVNDLCANEPTKGMLNQFMQPYTGVDIGTLNAYVVNTPQHETAYYTGMPCTFYTINSNTISAPTLNLNGLGAVPIKNFAGGSLIAGQVQANTPISLLYSDHFNAWLMQTAIGMPNGFSPLLAMISSSDGFLATSNTTATELGYVHNVTGPIQNQLNNKTNYSDFNVNLSTNGTQYLPNGLIIQWMYGVITFTPGGIGPGVITATYPIAFPNSALGWSVCSANGDGPPSIMGIGYSGSTASQVQIQYGAGSKGYYLTAIGH